MSMASWHAVIAPSEGAASERGALGADAKEEGCCPKAEA